MTTRNISAVLFYIIFFNTILLQAQSWLRVNQLGYLPNDIKAAVLLSKDNTRPVKFEVVDKLTGSVMLTSNKIKAYGQYGGTFSGTYRLDFSKLKIPGRYFIRCGEVISPSFSIGPDVYNGTADFLLRYMRQQRCGYNPFLKDSCHRQDGYIIYNQSKENLHIDARGGWHDASDYLQYVTTSANAVYQMLFAYQQNPSAFEDKFDANGLAGSNGIPDILDEAKWGLDWLVRLNPAKDEFYNQIADDRDHRGFRLPTLDTVSYGKGLERPVYFVTGKPQGLFKYKNRTTGTASTAGKFASAFSLGADLLQKYYPEFAALIKDKALNAYDFGRRFPGVCQTAPGGAPYFYEEDNYTDDMELAAAQFYRQTSGKEALAQAVEYAKAEPVTPWMGADTARHYQWYPFVNLGHYLLASSGDINAKKTGTEYMRQGLEKLNRKGRSNAFLNGIPYIWCSNNLVAAAITQARLYRTITGDKAYSEMEYALRDWLFGCNPWGTSMIYGLPREGDYPSDPHSALSRLYNYPIDGGLVDGPVYTAIFKRLLGIALTHDDTYKEFQTDIAVYHDDYGDYSTNEPTMDGTASLTFYLSSLQVEGQSLNKLKNVKYDCGGIIRMDTTAKKIYLCFTGHEFADGGETILAQLKKNNVKASFFFTGDFYRTPAFAPLLKKIVKDGHYLGCHSDKHLLYADWTKRDSTLVTKEQMAKDIADNYNELAKFGIDRSQAPFYMPPYEWHNNLTADWCKEFGLQIVNLTPGCYTNADYTIPSMGAKYKTSSELIAGLLKKESASPTGLNGAIILVHFGTHPDRTDKLYNRLAEMIRELKKRGYGFDKL